MQISELASILSNEEKKLVKSDKDFINILLLSHVNELDFDTFYKVKKLGLMIKQNELLNELVNNLKSS